MTQLVLPKTLTPGAAENVQDVQDNFVAVRTVINGQLGADNVQDKTLTGQELASNAVKIELGQTITLMGEVRVPVGNQDVIPPIFVPVGAAQITKLVRVRYRILAGTSVTFTLQRNGVDVPGAVGLVAGTAVLETDFADLVIADDDAIQAIVTAVAGTPQNLSVTLIFEHANL